jgi:endonuclease YncB( thermonuclease family)
MFLKLFKNIRRLLYLVLAILLVFAVIKKGKTIFPLKKGISLSAESGITSKSKHTAKTEITAENQTAVIARVVDGDTFVLDTKERVRLIGVDTPEKFQSSKLDKDAERSQRDKETIKKLGEAASQYVKELAEGKKVILKTDKYSDKTDRHGRLLRYVYLEDGTCINSKIIEAGYGNAYTNFKFEKMDEYCQLEREARINNRGLWKEGL